MDSSFRTIARLSIVFLVIQASSIKAAPVRFAIEEGRKVGRKGVGALCFPRSPFRWDRDYRPDAQEIEKLMSDVFGADHVGIVGTVSYVRFDLCQPHWGPLAKMVGDPTALRGHLDLKVTWQLGGYRTCASGQVHRTASRFNITSDMRGGVAVAVLGALSANATELVKAAGAGLCFTSPAANESQAR